MECSLHMNIWCESQMSHVQRLKFTGSVLLKMWIKETASVFSKKNNIVESQLLK